MFTKSKIISNEDMIVISLAKAHKAFEFAQWDYARSDAGVGGFLIDRCIADAKKLDQVGRAIGQGLQNDNADAKTAALIFDKLYKDGFKDGLFKKEIQDRFKEILPEKTITRLNEGAKMSDCMLVMSIAGPSTKLAKK